MTLRQQTATEALRDLHSNATEAPWYAERWRKGWIVTGDVVVRTVLAEMSALTDEANAALIVYLRNRAHLYANLEDAARALHRQGCPQCDGLADRPCLLGERLAALTESEEAS